MSGAYRNTLVVDQGPVRDAAYVLIAGSTLKDHVTVTHGIGRHPAVIKMTAGGVPFEGWGSGTQALWRLLSAIAYSTETVSLYDVVSRCDQRNTAAVADAVAALCGVVR